MATKGEGYDHAQVESNRVGEGPPRRVVLICIVLILLGVGFATYVNTERHEPRSWCNAELIAQGKGCPMSP